MESTVKLVSASLGFPYHRIVADVWLQTAESIRWSYIVYSDSWLIWILYLCGIWVPSTKAYQAHNNRETVNLSLRPGNPGESGRQGDGHEQVYRNRYLYTLRNHLHRGHFIPPVNSEQYKGSRDAWSMIKYQAQTQAKGNSSEG